MIAGCLNVGTADRLSAFAGPVAKKEPGSALGVTDGSSVVSRKESGSFAGKQPSPRHQHEHGAQNGDRPQHPRDR